jgi:TPR repeat protein
MRGCTNLGNMYRTGEGVPQDSTHAASLYKQACDGGFRPACGSE